MKISKTKLRQIIREEYAMMDRKSMHMGKAQACCSMQPAKLFGMCAQMCGANPAKSHACAELCACACRGDVAGCCKCLDAICACPKCESICTQHCGC